MCLSHSLYDIVPYHRALASFIALKLFTTAKRWLPLLLWNYSSLQSTSFLCCFETIHHCKALASFVALKLFTTAKHWLPLLLSYKSMQSAGFLYGFETIHHCKALASVLLWNHSTPQSTGFFVVVLKLFTAKHWLLLLLWNYSSLQSTGFLCCFNTKQCKITGFLCCFEITHHCKALALLLKAVLHQRAKHSVFFVPRPRALHWLFVFCLFSCCSSSGITSFLWYHSLLGEHWLSLVVVFKWELWLCSVFLTCWYLLFFFLLFLWCSSLWEWTLSVWFPWHNLKLAHTPGSAQPLMTVFWSSLGHG